MAVPVVLASLAAGAVAPEAAVADGMAAMVADVALETEVVKVVAKEAAAEAAEVAWARWDCTGPVLWRTSRALPHTCSCTHSTPVDLACSTQEPQLQYSDPHTSALGEGFHAAGCSR